MRKKYIHPRILIFLIVTISITTAQQDTWSKPENKALETDWIPVKGKCLSCKPSTDLQSEATDDQIKKVLSPHFPQTNFLFPPPNPNQYQFKQPRGIGIEHTPNIQFIPQYSQDNKYYPKLQPLFFQFGANQLNPQKFVFDSYKPIHNAPQQFLLPQVGYPYLQPPLLKTQEPLKPDGKWKFDTNVALNTGNQQFQKIRFPDSNLTVKSPQSIVKPEIQEVQLLYVPVETLMHQKGRTLKNLKLNVDRPSLPFAPYQQPQVSFPGNSFPSEVIRQGPTPTPTFDTRYNPQRPNEYYLQPPNPYIPNASPEVVRQENNFPSTPSPVESYTRQTQSHYSPQPPNTYIANSGAGILGQDDKTPSSIQQSFESYVDPQKSIEYFPPPSPNSYNEVIGNAGNSEVPKNIENQVNQPSSPPAYESYLYPQKTKEYFPKNQYSDNSVTGAVKLETQVGQESTTPRIYESHNNSQGPDNYFPQSSNQYHANSPLTPHGSQVKQESTTQQVHPLNSIKNEYFTQPQQYFPSSPPSQFNTPELQNNPEPFSYETLHSSSTLKDATTTSPLPASTTPQSQTTPYFGTYYSVQQGILETKTPESIPTSPSERTPQVTNPSHDQRYSYSEPFSQYPEQAQTYPVPHQPPLSVYMERFQNNKLNDILNILKYSKTVPVLDYIDENSPQVFVGPSELQAPKGYVKFDLPYLSSLDSNRIERMIDRLPFFVAPLNFKPPAGYSKIPFPAPHIGSVVVSNTTTFKDIHDKLQQKYVPTYQQSTTTTTTTTTEVPSTTIWTEPPSTRNPTRYQTTTTKKYRQRRPIHRGFPSTTARTTEKYYESTSKPDESAYIIPVTNVPEANSSSDQGFPDDLRQVVNSINQYSNEYNRASPSQVQQFTNELKHLSIPVQQYPNELSNQKSTPEQYSEDLNHQTTTTFPRFADFNQHSTHAQQYPSEYTQYSSPSQQYPNDLDHVSTPVQHYSTNSNQNPTVSEQHPSEKLFPSQQYTSEINQISTEPPQYSSSDLSHVSPPYQQYPIESSETTITGQESNIQNLSNFQSIKPLSQFMSSDQSPENPTYKNEVPWSPNPDYYTLPVTAGYQNFLDQTKSSSPTTEVEKSTTAQDETTTSTSEILRVRAKQRVSPSRYHYPRNPHTTESTEASTTTTEQESPRPNRRRRPVRPTTTTEARAYRGRSTKQPAYLRRRTTTTEQDTSPSTTENYEIPSSTQRKNQDSEAFWNEPVTVYHNSFTSSNPSSVYDNISSTGYVLPSSTGVTSNDESQSIKKETPQLSQSIGTEQDTPKEDKVNTTESVANTPGSNAEDPNWELSKEKLLLKQDSDSQKKAYDQQDKKVTQGRRRGTWVRKIRLNKKPQDVFETAESQNLAHLTNNDIKSDTKSTTESLNQDISLHTDFTDMLTQLLSDKSEPMNTTNVTEENNESIDEGFNEESNGNANDNQKADENKNEIDNNKNTETETEKTDTDEKEEKSTDVPHEASSSTTFTTTDDVVKSDKAEADNVEKDDENDSNIIATSTTTEISLETEICYKGKCVKSKKTKASDLLPVE